jgi:hypothetical protein
MNFLLHLLSLFATTPTEKAEIAVGRVVIKWVNWGVTYFGSVSGKQDIAAMVELAKDFGALQSPAGTTITLPSTKTHPETTYAYSTRDGIGGHLMPPGM